MTISYNLLLKPPLGTPINKAHPLGPNGGLVGCWLFNEGGGSTVFDLSGNVASLTTFVGNVGWRIGKYGMGLDFPGVTNYVAGPQPPQLVDGGDITIVVHFNSDQGLSIDQFIVKFGCCGILIDSPTGLRWYPDTGGGSPATIACTITAGVDYHVAVTHTGTNSNLYLDAVNIQSVSSVALDPTDATYKTHFGSLTTTGTWDFDGILNYVMVWDRVLSSSEIAQLYQKPFCMFKDPTEIAILGGYITPPVGNVGIMTPNTGFWGPTF